MSSTTRINSATAAHILVMPFPAQGHVFPLLDLTHQLLSRGLTVTIFTTPANLPILQPLLSAHPPTSISPLILPFPPHPSLPSGAENMKDLPFNSYVPLMSSLRRLHLPLLRWFASHPSPPSAILSDVFFGWTTQLASQLGIKRIVFWPSGATSLSVVNHIWKHRPQAPTTPRGTPNQNVVVPIDDLPGQPKFPFHQLSPIYRAHAFSESGAEFLGEDFKGHLASWGVVVNTLTEFEGIYLTHLMRDLGHDRVWAVGPLLSPGNEVGYKPKVRDGSNPIEEGVLSWLDDCGESEVVYVCFGSQLVMKNDQIEVLAAGLESSGVRFVWKIKEPNEGHADGDRFGKLPPGFEDRVAGRGLVIRGWAPQVLILKHKAVGAFLFHCGWNSALEALSVGVTLLGWPLENDHFSNAVLLFDRLKAGVRVGSGTNSLPSPSELALTLAESVGGSKGEQRSRMMQLMNGASEATCEGGSSSIALDALANQLSMLSKLDEAVVRECVKSFDVQEVDGAVVGNSC